MMKVVCKPVYLIFFMVFTPAKLRAASKSFLINSLYPSGITRINRESRQQHVLKLATGNINQEMENKLDLPLIIIPSEKIESKGNTMVVLITGDGGWTAFDRELTSGFAKNDIPVVALNSLKYFWKSKSPEQTAKDVNRVIQTYQELWKKEKVILIGYSFGADVMPFIYNRLPKSMLSTIKSLALLSPSSSTDFKVHISDLLNLGTNERQFSVPEEIKKIQKISVWCFFGKDEKAIPVTFSNKSTTVMLDGGHHYINAFPAIFKKVTE